LALGGAIYDADLMQAYCQSSRRGLDCDLAPEFINTDFAGSSNSYRDDRVKAIFAMAPAVGPAMTPSSLESITVPVSIMATKDDELLLYQNHAAYYAQNIPGAQFTLLPEGGHFIYMACDVPTAIADFFIDEFDLCGRQFDVDKPKLRREISKTIHDFLNEAL
jgi:predicted dienelactone hydrolase